MHFSLRIAFSSLATHKARAFMAMLGVFVGALALTGVQHASKAMVVKAEQEVEKLGPNLFVARAGQIRMRRSGSARAVGEDVTTFTVADARAVVRGSTRAVRGVPFVTRTMPVKHGATKVLCRLVGTEPEYTEIRNFRPRIGRFFTPKEVDARAKVCVLGVKIAERLFGRPELAVGEYVFFFRAAARVIGVMEPKGADITGEDQDEQVFTPITTYMRRFANQDWITGVYVRLRENSDAEKVKRNVAAILRERHRIQEGEKDDFALLTAKDTMRLQREALDLVGTLGLISSSVSFAVGGLGIWSVMVLLVRTRRLEIGVRRAVGARRKDIVGQFLAEAGLLSGVGGTLGVLAAMGLGLALYFFDLFPLVIEPWLVASILLGSAGLGVAAGAIPAWRASRYEILDVLRSYE
jgi:putative ABC transport system permease protein